MWADSRPDSQPSNHPSGRPDRQHALLLFTLQVKEVSAHSSARVCFPEEEKQLLSWSIWRTVLLTEQQTLQCCDRFVLSVWKAVLHLGQKYFVSLFGAENSSAWKLFGPGTWSISHALNSVYPWVYKTAGFISPLQSMQKVFLGDLSIPLAQNQQAVKANELKQWTSFRLL